jgi:hypothetical protein
MARVLTGSGRPYLTNVEMLGGIELNAGSGFTNLPLASGSNFAQGLSSSFAASSGSVIQSMNYLKSQIDAVSSGADFDASGSKGATQSMVLASETFAFATGSSGGVGISLFDSQAGGGINVSASFDTLAEAAIADGDFIPFYDTDGNASKKEAVGDLATLFAGAGLEAGSSVINVVAGANGGLAVATDSISLDMDELTAITAVVSGDSLGIVQQAEASDPTKKITVDKLVEAIAGTVTTTGLADDGITLKLDIQNMTGITAIADADLIVVDDGANGTLRKITRANLLGSAVANFEDRVVVTGTLNAAALSGSGNLTVVGNGTFNGNLTNFGSADVGTTLGVGTTITAGSNIQAGGDGVGSVHTYVSGTELRLQGTNEAGLNKSWALSVSGGMLQINAAT